jgi:hypothetical protein
MQEEFRLMTCIEALLELMLAKWWDAVHRFWLVLVVGICYIRESILFGGGELVILELLTPSLGRPLARFNAVSEGAGLKP